jgi:hypothetical protein
MDAGWTAVVVTLLLGVPTLIYAIRATRVGEMTLEFEQRRLHAEKMANLEFASPHGRPEIWRFMSGTGHQTAWVHGWVRNRGPSYAVELNWSATMGSDRLNIGNAPDFLLPDPIDSSQVTMEIPLGPDLAPKRDPIRIVVELIDDEKRKAMQWCLRFAGDPTSDPESWTLENLDCISLKPRNGRWAQPFNLR